MSDTPDSTTVEQDLHVIGQYVVGTFDALQQLINACDGAVVGSTSSDVAAIDWGDTPDRAGTSPHDRIEIAEPEIARSIDHRKRAELWVWEPRITDLVTGVITPSPDNTPTEATDDEVAAAISAQQDSTDHTRSDDTNDKDDRPDDYVPVWLRTE